MADHHGDLDQQSAARRRQPADTESKSTADGPTHPVVRLQSQVGNTQVARLLAQRAETPEDEAIQPKRESVGTEGGPAGPDTTARIQAMRGSGSPLEPSTRVAMESALGAPFGDVRVHSNSESDMLNRRLTARAFTTGSDIFLRSDASPSDPRLMAHELTHVVQQRSMAGGAGGMQVGAAGDAHEQSADAAAAVVASAPAATTSAAQRQEAAEPEEIQAAHDLAQREGEEPEDDINALHDLSQREVPDENEPEE